MNDLSGTTLDQYYLVEPIGKGGMATVYRAYQQTVGRHVAVKVLSLDLADEAEFISRFEHEARVVAGLQHPNIVAVHDFGRAGVLTYLVMRLMEGGSLDQLLRAGRVPTERIIQLTWQIAGALDYAHGRGIVHRDLKPTNVLLDESGVASLTDFGIAKIITSQPIMGLTAAGTVMGTPTYMAPEQWRSEPVDARTDVYALGIIIYQMLTGRVPFAAETPHGLMYQHLDSEPPPLRAQRPDLPLAVEPVLRKALAKRRYDRYASAGELARDLENALRFPAQTVYEPLPRRPRRAEIPPIPDDELVEDEPLTDEDDDSAYAALPRSIAPPMTPELEAEVPPLPPYQPRRAIPQRDELYRGEEPVHITRFLGTVVAVLVGVGILFAVTLAVALMLARDEDPASTTPPAATFDPGGSPQNQDQLPRAQIEEPANNASAALGETVRIRFSAQGPLGISRVELRRFNQTIDVVSGEGRESVSGTFSYPATSTGAHVLEVVPWSEDVRGTAATVTINVQ